MNKLIHLKKNLINVNLQNSFDIIAEQTVAFLKAIIFLLLYW